jgi:hypothetical protein
MVITGVGYLQRGVGEIDDAFIHYSSRATGEERKRDLDRLGKFNLSRG